MSGCLICSFLDMCEISLCSLSHIRTKQPSQVNVSSSVRYGSLECNHSSMKLHFSSSSASSYNRVLQLTPTKETSGLCGNIYRMFLFPKEKAIKLPTTMRLFLRDFGGLFGSCTGCFEVIPYMTLFWPFMLLPELLPYFAFIP